MDGDCVVDEVSYTGQVDRRYGERIGRDASRPLAVVPWDQLGKPTSFDFGSKSDMISRFDEFLAYVNGPNKMFSQRLSAWLAECGRDSTQVGFYSIDDVDYPKGNHNIHKVVCDHHYHATTKSTRMKLLMVEMPELADGGRFSVEGIVYRDGVRVACRVTTLLDSIRGQIPMAMPFFTMGSAVHAFIIETEDVGIDNVYLKVAYEFQIRES